MNKFYYYYISSENRNWSGKDLKSFIHPTKAFKLIHNGEIDTSSGYKLVGFTKIDLNGEKNHVVNINRQFVFIDDKRFESTDLIRFRCEGITMGRISMRFTKNQDGGSYVIMNSQNEYIIGTVFLYLDNNSVIKLVDRNKRDIINEDNRTFNRSIYYLTKSEVELLKQVNIETIRYKTSPFLGQYSTNSLESHILNNRNCTETFFINRGKVIERISFDLELTRLIE